MHALLGLSASHLTAISSGDHHAAAIKHRILAIKGFNATLSAASTRPADDDALLGACYALAFQSTYMRDGLPEFLTMLRGTGLVTAQCMARESEMLFALTPAHHYKVMMPRLQNLPIINSNLIEGANVSLLELKAKRFDGVDLSFYKSLVEIAEGLKIGSLQGESPSSNFANDKNAHHTYLMHIPPGYLKFIALYQAIANLPQEPFNQFIAPTNLNAPFLLAHFFGLQVLLSPILSRTWDDRNIINPLRHRLDWVKDIHDGLPRAEQHFLQWPLDISERVRAELDEKVMGFDTTILRRKEGSHGTFI
jgi:hypothetical protein